MSWWLGGDLKKCTNVSGKDGKWETQGCRDFVQKFQIEVSKTRFTLAELFREQKKPSLMLLLLEGKKNV